jgi:beta-glucanase (GH16 family)
VSSKVPGSVLSGGVGPDALYSPGGRARLAGGAGDDTYWVWEHTDQVVEAPREGIDTVIAHAHRFSLPAEVENLVVEGRGAHGTGKALDNLITGKAGSQTLDGGPGNDVLTGGPGADTFIIRHGQGSDVITDFTPGEDTIRIGGEGSPLTSLAALRAALSQAGEDAVLDLGGGESLTFRGVQAADLAPQAFRLPIDRTALRPSFAEEFEDPARFRATADGRDPASGEPVWRSVYHWGERGIARNGEVQFYGDADTGPNPFRVADGALEITAAPAEGLPRGLTHGSGLITSQASFAQTYGYFEMRAQLPAAQGLWPAFWLLPADLSWPPEIDVMEMLGHDPGTIYASLHWKEGGADQHRTTAVPVADVSAGFHRFALSWRPDEIRWFVDDLEVHRMPTPPGMHQPFYLLANLAVGGPDAWPGAAAGDATGTMKIDYIRAAQFKDLEPGPARR